MGLIQQFLKSFRETDEMEAGLIQKTDGTVWLVNPDGSETQLPGGGGPTILTGSGTPFGTISSPAAGTLYVDTNGGGLYIADELGVDAWLAVGGNTNAAPGGVHSNGGDTYLRDTVGARAEANNGNASLLAGATGKIAELKGFGGLDNVTASDDGAGNPTVAFFGQEPAPQQATPVTLGDVIALLQAYGLSA